MAPLVKCPQHNHEVLSPEPQNTHKQLGLVLNIYTPSTQEAEIGRSLEFTGQPV